MEISSEHNMKDQCGSGSEKSTKEDGKTKNQVRKSSSSYKHLKRPTSASETRLKIGAAGRPAVV
jgi:hypothetical protein